MNTTVLLEVGDIIFYPGLRSILMQVVQCNTKGSACLIKYAGSIGSIVSDILISRTKSRIIFTKQEQPALLEDLWDLIEEN